MPASITPPAADLSQAVLVVAYPGNTAPHYRVQVLAGETQPRWQLFASFADQNLAQVCLARLRRSGQSARLIAFRRVATAA
jgi:hypothetical protein